MYYDKLLTSASAGKVSLASLINSTAMLPAFATLSIINPQSSGGLLGLGDSSMAALPADALQPGDFYHYGPMSPGRPWQTTQIFLWFENSSQIVRVRGESL